jgi:cyclic pyranopterin phosphate synthase
MSDLDAATRAHDRCGRTMLRLSVTDRCNLRCRYCMPATGVPSSARADLLSIEELGHTAGWLCDQLGVGRIKLTGGEPLVRRGIECLIEQLAALPGVEEVSATTNGTVLEGRAVGLRQAGLARVNVSVDTLDPDHFRQLTRGGELAEVVRGIDAALAAGIGPVKLNTVLLASRWRRDVPELLDFAQDRELEIRFIELMRTGTEARWAVSEYVAAPVVKEWLTGGHDADARPVTRVSESGPARRTVIRWRGRDLRVGWITPRSEPFCAGCNRIRLDARGVLRRCLMDPAPFSLADRLGSHDHGRLRADLDLYLAGKRQANLMDLPLPMVSVGG